MKWIKYTSFILEQNPVELGLSKLKYRQLYFALFSVFVLAWQSTIYFSETSVTADYRRADATGLNHYWGQEFLYFYYNKNIFPLATTDSSKVYSSAGAQQIIDKRPETLRMEWGHWFRFGESARIFLYLPYAYLKKSAENPQILFSNYLFFSLTLVFLFYAFCRIRRPLLGALLVLVVGFSPFMQYEIYNNNNVFGLMGAYVFLLFALHLPFMNKSNNNTVFLVAAFSGLIGAFMFNIRAESAPILVSCLLVYVLNGQFNFLKKLLPPVLLVLSFILTNTLLKSYFENKYETTKQIVENAGGTPFDGGTTLVHPFWHPIYCGLGDYDTKYGLVLHDTAVYNFVLPILRQQTGLQLKYPGNTIYEMAEYYDKDSLYYKKAETIPGFDNIVKNRFIKMLSNDPLWYAGIIANRIYDFFFELSPVGITIGLLFVNLPFHGIFVIFLLGFLFYQKAYNWLKMLLFTMPLGASVILIYSAYNNSYQSVFQFVAFAIYVYLLIGLIWHFKFGIKKFKETFKEVTE